MHLVTQRVANRMQHDLVADPATVHVEMLRVAVGNRAVGFQHKSVNGQHASIGAHGGRRVDPICTEHGRDARRPRLYRPAVHCTRVVRQLQRDVVAREAKSAHGVEAVCIFGCFRFQEAAPRRGVEEQFGHRDRRACTRTHGLGRLALSALHLETEGVGRADRATGD